MKLGEILVRKGLISPLQLENAVAMQNKNGKHQKLGELLMFQGLISKNQLNDSLLEQQWRQQGLWVID
ncbi:hypothetical protein [Pseudanabaena sp. PCC 6802]|uniref:hypothetical protein n=1 Tax=Pseudanabaena sp. PCC 6802 TaxID=118173 RepID=UPI0003479ACB|nr:hypothetical protein [Pseudanabaena sp. PCC 6802]